MTTLWKTIERPGYFGSRRDALHAEYDQTYGVDGWQLAWIWGDGFIDNQAMYMIYEDSYFNFLQNNVEVLDELVNVASDVYDDALTNVDSGLDYLVQETGRTHVQDISIRRAVLRLGRHFRGGQLIQIRDRDGDHPLSITLSPGKIPFHFPELIEQPEISGWWDAGSVESFYQSNKVLQARV